MPQKTYEVTAPDGRTFELTGDHQPTESELTEIFAKVAKPEESVAPDTSKARTWTDVAVDALPAVGATIGAIGAGPTVLGAGAAGAAGAYLGGSLRQGINKLRGLDVPTTLQETAKEIGSEALSGAVGGATGAIGAKAIPLAGQALKATGEGMQSGSDLLRWLISDKGGWKTKLVNLTIPPLVRTSGKVLAKTGAAIAGPSSPSSAEALSARLARIPIEGRLGQIGATSEAAQAIPKIAADTAQQLADDISLIRESITKGMDPKVAIRIVANGSAEYADALKDAYTASVKTGGLPVPESIQKLLQSPSFRNLPR